LTQKEFELCESLKIPFCDFVVLKEVLVRKSISEGVLSLEECRTLCQIDAEKFDGVFNFLVSYNLILPKTNSNNDKPQSI
jgi:hypothetical protein